MGDDLVCSFVIVT